MASTAALELLVQLNDQASKGLDDIGEKGGGMGDAIKNGAAIAGGAILGLGGILVGATKAAADDQAEQDRLNNTLKNAIPNWDGNTSAVADYITKQQDMAFGDSELRDSLGFLVGQTGDLTTAQELQATAMDLARAKGISLEAASKAVGKVDNDNIKVLGRLGIKIDEHATKEEALAAIRAQTAGQAETYANSAAGSLERAQNSMGEAMESVGAAILPLVEGPLKALADWFSSPEVQAGITTIATNIGQFLAGAFTTLQGVIAVVLPVIQGIFQFVIDNKELVFGALATIITAFVIPAFVAWATTMLTVALPALIATMAPILAAAAPFLAIAAAIGLLWLAFENNFLGIRDLVVPIVDAVIAAVSRFWTEMQPQFIAAWDAISSTVVNAWTFISGLVVAGVQALMEAWNTNWGGMRTIIETAWNLISGIVTTAWTIVTGIISAGLSLLSGDWEGAWNTISTMLSDVWTLITTDILPNALTMIWTLLTDFLPQLIGVLLSWTGAFFNWIWTDIIPQLPGWLGSLVSVIWTWVSENAPIMLEKLVEWTTQFFNWIMNDVVPQIPGWLGNIAGALWTWLTETAGSLLDKLINEWVPSLWQWITGEGGVLSILGTKLGEIWDALTGWITKTATDIYTAVQDVGKNIADGIGKGFANAWEGVKNNILGPLMGLPANLNAAQGAKSPATLFMPVGAYAAQGIGVGFTDEWPAVALGMAQKLTDDDTISNAVKKLCDEDILAPIKKLCDSDLPPVIARLTDADGVIAGPIVALCDADGPVATAVRTLCDADGPIVKPLRQLCDSDIPAAVAGVNFDAIPDAMNDATNRFITDKDRLLAAAKQLADELASMNDGSGYAGNGGTGGPSGGGGRILGATAAGGGGGSRGGGGNTFNITVNAGWGSDGRGIAQSILEELEYALGDMIAIRRGTRAHA